MQAIAGSTDALELCLAHAWRSLLNQLVLWVAMPPAYPSIPALHVQMLLLLMNVDRHALCLLHDALAGCRLYSLQAFMPAVHYSLFH